MMEEVLSNNGLVGLVDDDTNSKTGDDSDSTHGVRSFHIHSVDQNRGDGRRTKSQPDRR